MPETSIEIVVILRHSLKMDLKATEAAASRIWACGRIQNI